ncbi:hypothetical protein N183_16070 [Sinorhizobium sp. Sb3]|jgi:hypothetical protein|nr:hypothetical protein N183_16070 [Sinorhizobium sp. Sb3]
MPLPIATEVIEATILAIEVSEEGCVVMSNLSMEGRAFGRAGVMDED